MYALSISARLHGSTCLDQEGKVVLVKCLNSLHFLHLFICFSISRGHYYSNFICFCMAATPQCIASCTLFMTNFLCVSWRINRSPLQITLCSIINLFLISLFDLSAQEQFPRLSFFSYSRCYPTSY